MNDWLAETESRDDATAGLDLQSSAQLVSTLAGVQRRAAEAVVEQQQMLAGVVDRVVERLRRGGRLHYVGAGTSGRLAVLDAAEMPPTFGTPLDLVCAHIAGGEAALRRAVEGAEDDAQAGARAMHEHVRAKDAVIGISASGSAPYVIAAIAAAREMGALTAAIVNTPGSPLADAAEHAIVLDTGAEPIAGSTRMKAGTSQKIALNTISTAVMVRLGKVYDNLMVDLVATNEKLHKRALRLVCMLTSLEDDAARNLLAQANGSVKTAVVMARRGVDAAAARALLDACDGRLRDLL